MKKCRTNEPLKIFSSRFQFKEQSIRLSTVTLIHYTLFTIHFYESKIYIFVCKFIKTHLLQIYIYVCFCKSTHVKVTQ